MPYGHRTFCQSDCTNTRCWRHFGPAHREAAQASDQRVWMDDFSSNCIEYQKPKRERPT